MRKQVQSTDIYGKTYTVPVDQLVWRPAAYAIVVRDGNILLTKQHKAFHLPGGAVDLGEMPEAAAIREVMEETGLIVDNPRFAGHISGFFTLTSQLRPDVKHVHSILLYYLCDYAGGELSVEGFEEEEKLVGEMAEWIPLDHLDTILAGSTVNWRRLVKESLGLASNY